MEDDMVADAALWALFAASIAFISFGCRMTKPTPMSERIAAPAHTEARTELDRAA
jgi:hypothetical protein